MGLQFALHSRRIKQGIRVFISVIPGRHLYPLHVNKSNVYLSPAQDTAGVNNTVKCLLASSIHTHIIYLYIWSTGYSANVKCGQSKTLIANSFPIYIDKKHNFHKHIICIGPLKERTWKVIDKPNIHNTLFYTSLKDVLQPFFNFCCWKAIFQVLVQ